MTKRDIWRIVAAAAIAAVLFPASPAEAQLEPTRIPLDALGAASKRHFFTVTNLDGRPTKAVVVVVGSWEGFRCHDDTLCSGLLGEGGTWAFGGDLLSHAADTAIVYSISTQRLSDIGVDIGIDDVIADYLCESLWYEAVGSCDGWERFDRNYQSGKDYAGVPLAEAYGGRLDVAQQTANTIFLPLCVRDW